ncbi:hypothetical protein GCK72_007566 [Caenorhabditis remanei]|uniref:BTB domain-containing protein n=1 Tax=Caenorhabditis remanei TaxID=31234 RepID=A0A6A5HMF9_CAERE|nr:hypothetical protein GCK72_007566 [Caenorhabditis remanei]KAF1767607.1 hypothetical protein GCK72_007566 [Caenorhabditis remanei]
MLPTIPNERKRPAESGEEPDAGPKIAPAPEVPEEPEIIEIPIYNRTQDFTSNSDPNLSDCVLVADGRKFYADKKNLARHSLVLNKMFFGPSSNQDEIKLDDVTEETLQKFLELSVGCQGVLSDTNVEGVVKLAHKWSAPVIKEACGEYVSKECSLSLEKKLELASLFRLSDKVKTSLVSSIKDWTILDSIKDSTITIGHDTCLMNLLFNKCMELQKNQPVAVNTAQPLVPQALPQVSRALVAFPIPLPIPPLRGQQNYEEYRRRVRERIEQHSVDEHMYNRRGPRTPPPAGIPDFIHIPQERDYLRF